MKILDWFFNILIIAFIFSFFSSYDDTDDKSRSFFDRRSGLGLYIDHGTGCHYVSKGFGGITPRLDSQGHPICRDWDKRK